MTQAVAPIRGINVIHRGLNHVRRHDRKQRTALLSKLTKQAVRNG